MYSKLLAFLLILVAIPVFYLDVARNYAEHVTIKRSLVAHPEFVPSSTSVSLFSG